MFRCIVGKAFAAVSSAVTNATSVTVKRFPLGIPLQKASYSSLQMQSTISLPNYHPISGNAQLLQMPFSVQLQTSRDLTKYSLTKGKRKSVKAVLKRFKRLEWGGWIRTRCGRHKKLFKKSPALKRRLRQHVLTNSTQSYLLDKMVTKFWRRAKNWVDDPYAPYNKRDEFFATKSKTFKV